MVWFKVDDGFYSSKKVLSIPRTHRLAAVGLWTMAGNWSGRELTDGRVPEYVLAELGSTPRLRQALTEARLWLDRGSAGIEFHAWVDYQPTRAEVEAERAKTAERQRRWRTKQSMDTRDESVSNAVTHTVTDTVTNGAPTRPDPTRPIDASKEASKTPRKRGTRVPKNFVIDDDMRAWARNETPHVDVDKKLGEWVDYWQSVTDRTGIKTDWVATWRNGMRKQEEFALRDLARNPASPPVKRRQFKAGDE
jgi:hypothetical protein